MKRKPIYLFYIIYLFLVILFTIWDAGKTTDRYLDAHYGMGEGKTLELTQDKLVEARFVLSADKLAGIGLKFRSDYGFQDERISAVLTDADTGELLAEDTAEMKYELVRNKDSGSYVYFRLPVEQAKGRKASLELTYAGGEFCVYPKLILSDKKALDSEVYVSESGIDEAKQVQGGNLDFYAKYSTKPSSGLAGSVQNGLLWIAIGSLLFLWAKKRTGNGKTKKPDERKSGGKDSSILQLILVLSGCCLLLAFVYHYHVKPQIESRHFVKVVKEKDAGERLDITEQGAERRFTVKDQNLSGIKIRMALPQGREKVRVRMELTDYTSGQRLCEKVGEFSFPNNSDEEIAWSIGLQETVVLKGKHELGLRFIEEEADGRGEKNMETGQVLAVSLDCNHYGFLAPMYLIFCGMLLLFVLILYWCCFVKKLDLAKLFAVFAMSMGICFTLVLGLYSVPDEPSHLDSAYQLSNELLGVQKSEKPGYIYKRADDADMEAEQKRELSVLTYERLYRQLCQRVKDDTLVECAALNNFSNAGRIFYLPQALGISAGRILKLGFLPTMLLGRLFALAAYVLLTCLAIRKLPYGKESLFLLGILPVALQEAASFSYDAVINGIAFLYLGYCMHMVCRDFKEITLADMAVLAVSGCLMAGVKGSVYLPLCLLPLLRILRRKGGDRRETVFTVVLTALFFYAFLSGNLTDTIVRLSQEQGAVVGGSYGEELYTFGYFLEHPQRLVGIFANTLYTNTDSYLRNLLGGSLSWLDIKLKWYVLIGFLLLLLLSCIRQQPEISISGWEKAGMGLAAGGCFGLTCLSMLLAWTPVTSDHIQGVQGRYFIPFILLVLFMLRNSFFTVKKDIRHNMIFFAGLLDVIALLQVLQCVFE